MTMMGIRRYYSRLVAGGIEGAPSLYEASRDLDRAYAAIRRPNLVG